MKKFTLIELLVIVSIIAILITLLLPSLRKAREASRYAVCMSNQKQIGMAIITYKEEGIGYLPQIDKIDRFLVGRGVNGDVNSVWLCPSRPQNLSHVTEKRPVCYTFNKNLRTTI